ncbi:peroxiredoxin [Bordetella sp. H567]|uniref:OsmC family protein n=1 Tax=Bordetella sp. H567 TaxID=1697043 RepID=UPI00081C862F|nr:OsmC family protein [Bordetella sp. H567]AOB30055.1 peroxiredoxin [Bordetella sp. H567]
MAHGEHKYQVQVRWTGNRGSGTSGYGAYGRDHVIRADGKPEIAGSADPAFRGDARRWNPEDLLVASASACHKLWYLHLCADAGIVVLDYVDNAEGTMAEAPGRFTAIVLRPDVVIGAGGDPDEAKRLHHVAHGKCYIANSVNFPITCEPTIRLASG